MEPKRTWVQWNRALFGAGVGTVLLLALLGGMAALFSSGVLDVGWMDLAAAAALVTSSFVSAAAAGRGGGRLDGAVAPMLVWLLLLGVNAAAYGGEASGWAAGLAAMAGGSGAAYLLLHLSENAGRHRHRRRRYR